MKKYGNFIDDLKSSNIASNITSLVFCSEQIGLLLNQLKYDSSNHIISSNLDSIKKIIEKTKKQDPKELTENYIKFGNIFKTLLDDLNVEQNIEFLKKIAILYIDVAKLTKDDKIKNIAFSIANQLSN